MSYRLANASGGNIKTLGTTANYPLPQFPTIQPEDDLTKTYNTEHHTRHGIIMGTIDYGAKRLWPLEWQFINSAEVAALQVFADLRVFQFDNGDGTLINVRMVEKDFKPVNQRGGYFGVKMTLEEL
uniref:Uncharacterized protein n=1 Tax=uncultured marine virus TaxID=186617 RepID=A0A0F7L5X9_9VIRU|nr:hypothetical protein [uncultured marine virus]